MSRLGPFEENTIVVGDCIEVMAQMPDGCAKLVFADPPYNLSGKGMQTCHSGKRMILDKGAWDWMGRDEFVAFNRKWLTSAKRILVSEGTLWITGTYHNHPIIGVLLQLDDWLILNDIIWFKRNAVPQLAATRFCASTELIWWAAKSKPYKFNYEEMKELNQGKQMRNLWDIPATRHITGHTAEKPATLLKRIVLAGSDEGDLVFDPFMGSGTTAVVADRLGRKFFGCDINPDYVEMALERLEKDRAGRQLALL